MLTPADGTEGVKKFVVKSVKEAGGKACPPFTVGVGVGGTFNEVTKLAKEASALRWCGKPNEDPTISELEEELLAEINSTGIGPMGIGGDTTAVAVHIEEAGTHIAGNPVAVNLMCHPRRRYTVRITNDNSYEFRDRFEGTDHEIARVKKAQS
jgi:tartrate/fumarate subfamily iron-sulfur-dependent hydro-lyase alpha chain